MKSLVGNGKDFEFNSKINRKPMEIFKNRCNVAELSDLEVSKRGKSLHSAKWSLKVAQLISVSIK